MQGGAGLSLRDVRICDTGVVGNGAWGSAACGLCEFAEDCVFVAQARAMICWLGTPNQDR